MPSEIDIGNTSSVKPIVGDDRGDVDIGDDDNDTIACGAGVVVALLKISTDAMFGCVLDGLDQRKSHATVMKSFFFGFVRLLCVVFFCIFDYFLNTTCSSIFEISIDLNELSVKCKIYLCCLFIVVFVCLFCLIFKCIL